MPSSSQNAKAKSAATSFPKGPRLGGGTGREASALGLPASGSAPTHHWSAVLVCSHALGRWRTSCGIAGSAGTSIGASTTLMRSWLVEVKSTSRVVSEVSVTPDTRVIEWTCTSGNCLVSSSAVSSSRTRSMISELLSPSPARP